MDYTEQLLENLEINQQKHKAEIKKVFKHLKKKKPKQLDNIVHDLHDEVFDKVDCLSCANCCKTLGPRITDNDVARLSKHFKIKPSEFVSQYLRIDEDNDFVFKEMPCPFLMPDNYCMVYESRPKACREYPHTDRKRFYQLLSLSEKNIATCPAVLEISLGIVKHFE
jgi:Fe-S-cluster containining protein